MTTTATELGTLVDGLLERARTGGIEGAGAVAAAIDRPGSEPITRSGGRTVSFAEDGTALPDDSGPDVDRSVTDVYASSLFDMASVTKVVTALTAATFLDEGALGLGDLAIDHLGPRLVPDARITVRHLLTHTAGLPPTMPLWRIQGTREERLAEVGGAALHAAPGTTHAYSCIGFILLGEILTRLGGEDLPQLARRRVLAPAGAATATWWPDAAARSRTVATEYAEDPPRGLVRGEVHDETAWVLEGVGNAGLFATLEDALAIARVLAGRAPGPVLSQGLRAEMARDQLTASVTTDAPWRQGLGVRIGQELPDGSVQTTVVGHPGFTGTALWADPAEGTVAVLLTNRVHPRRDRFEVLEARREIARQAFARAGTA
ncbi:hypothetical protein DEO23_14360 [Brachybacterium endophyticum]|uniref:Beta-lactamase-related domain-containing protein n=1 Tax=Brachybacterium endophyticum TaxID=2182385 RepID=A0A2U2RHK6_9MICO|nr:serine hydrolase domain-containing protein [Brachybacterium endophyticum]PWH05255.1 hypothetical protein DEO23_14360 [Brachybacterium endophyticum]